MEEDKKIKIAITNRPKMFIEKETAPIAKSKKNIAIKIIIGIIIIAIITAGLFFIVKSRKNKSSSEKSSNNSTQPITQGKVIDIEVLEEDLPASPEVIAQGKFNNVEQILEGKALFIESNKEKYLRLEDFKVVNGQDIHVYLSPILNLDKSDVIDLGLLKSISGNFNYPLDNNIDLAKYSNVLIWSNTFNAFFGYANLLGKELPPEPQTPENQNAEENIEQPAQNDQENSQILPLESENVEQPKIQPETENQTAPEIQEETNLTEPPPTTEN